jgi:hypothetical protein
MASPVMACGWECGTPLVASPGAGGHWFQLFTTPTIETAIKRTGDRSLRCNPAGLTEAVISNAIFSGNRQIGRLYVYFASLPTASSSLITFGGDSAAPAVRFNLADSKLYAAVGTTLGASGVTVTTATWYRIDFDFNVNTAGADFCDVQIEGTACGQATATGTSTGSTQCAIGLTNGTCTADVYFDDFLASSTAADYPLGAGYVHHFVPTSDGTHNIAGTGDFQRTLTATDILNATTTAYQLIDDVPLESGASVDWINMVAPVNASDYVECIFGPAPGIPTPTTEPRALEHIIGIHQASTAAGNMRVQYGIPAGMVTLYDGPAAAGSTTVVYKRLHDSSGGSLATFLSTPWRLRFLSGNTVDATPDQYLDCAMIEAEYVPVVAGDPIAEIFNFQQRMTAAHRASSY